MDCYLVLFWSPQLRVQEIRVLQGRRVSRAYKDQQDLGVNRAHKALQDLRDREHKNQPLLLWKPLVRVG